MRRRFGTAALLLFLLAAAPVCGADTEAPSGAGAAPAEERLLYVDVHAHLLGSSGPQMLQGGAVRAAGGRQVPDTHRQPGGAPDYAAAAAGLIRQMDTYRIRTMLIMPPPRTDANRQENELADLARAVRQHPQRLALAGGGDILNPLLHRYPADRVDDAVRAEFTAAAERLVRDYGISAFGEIAALHLSFFPGHVFSQVAPDHPLCLLLADLAARYDIPIDWHMEAVPADMPVPAGFGSSNTQPLRENIAAFERLLAHNRGARIVWQHIGWDNTGGMNVPLLRRLLAAHPNLSLAWKVEERELQLDRRTPMPNRVVDGEWRVRPEWQELFAAYPDRFVVGTDEFFGIPGVTRRMPGAFDETWRAFAQLPRDVQLAMGRDNPRRIYRLPAGDTAPAPAAVPAPGAGSGRSPFDDQAMLVILDDGRRGDAVSARVLFDHASVPDLVVLPDGRWLVYFVDFSDTAARTEGLGVGMSTDGGVTWQRQTVSIGGLTGEKAVDPDAVVLSDGRIRLYYFASRPPAHGRPGDPAQQEGAHEVRSAVSADGIRFTEEAGCRFACAGLTDPDVVRLADGTWRMYFPAHEFSGDGQRRGRLRSASSPDGLTFTADAGERLAGPGIPGSLLLPDGRVRLFRNDRGGIFTWVSADGMAFTREGLCLRDPAERGIADPSPVLLPDGRIALVYKRMPAGQPVPADLPRQ